MSITPGTLRAVCAQVLEVARQKQLLDAVICLDAYVMSCHRGEHGDVPEVEVARSPGALEALCVVLAAVNGGAVEV